ncbi:sigma-54 interaction domain-containing protein [Papillibacter cinnamivorans]|uniref:Transcriptional regulator containing PAS, AAA-type ATPase, and DNA-binding Fis domains n=1 Tax=Papillibacter cinnamivorans DSM 12816 TaxID=1122930 RepID=A0A1W2C9Y9_9FIRM|nr:sigma 54-interacting transcriptional regulator [Papillibacter cinnamivorans]SMC81804.1 Transcriptional regulator containing PAS, AAA-type ATPase, and DNA-binding Fis domains [Papillibacter cinnamivorans DSM 12816]
MSEIQSANDMGIALGTAFIDDAFFIKFADSQFSHLLQVERAELFGKKIFELFPEIDWPAVIKKTNVGHRICRENGQILIVNFIKILIKSQLEYLIVLQDNTYGENIVEQYNFLNKQFQGFTQMLDRLSDGVYICDASGWPIYWNEAFTALSGLDSDYLKNKTIYDALRKGIVNNSCVLPVLETQQPDSACITYPSGKTCLASGFPIFVDGKLAMAFGIVRDLTELILLQKQLEKQKYLTMTYRNKLLEVESKISNKYSFVTHSKAMKDIYNEVLRVSEVDCPILLRGETGVGKDFLAKFIHDISKSSREGKIISINCGAIPENLIESELFGYEKGAFTGAKKEGKAGLFELANNGTAVLDEIGDMPLHLQIKLLNCIQDKGFFRVGGTQVVNFNARIIATTNTDLEKLIDQGKFRLDLYYRLNVITIEIPPLRERRDDILPIAQKFLDEFNRKYNRTCYYSPESIGFLLNYSWPGNIRELKNVIERVVIMCKQDSIELRAFEKSTKATIYSLHPYLNIKTTNIEECQALKYQTEMFEASYIKDCLNSQKTLEDAAVYLGIDRSTLVRKKKKYKL